MKQLIQEKTGLLDRKERLLFSVAYKNVVGAKRSAYRIVSSITTKEQNKAHQSISKAYQKEIVAEQEELCNEALELIDIELGKYRAMGKRFQGSQVPYLKMKGDYYRYLVEVADGEEARNSLALKAKAAYEDATLEAKELPNTHPIKLGLALNFSVFHYEIMNDGKTACDGAKKAFDDAIAELDTLKEDSYKDSTLIMQLLRDNLTLWSSGNEQEDEDMDDEDI